MSRRRELGSGVVALFVLGAWLLWGSLARGPEPASAAAPGQATLAPETELVAVTRQDLSESIKITATTGFGLVKSLPIEAEGTVTWAPDQGSVLTDGSVAVMIDNKPVITVAGATPLYRELRLVPSYERDEANVLTGLQTGEDVAQLQRFLLEQGYDDAGRLVDDGRFGRSTERALEAWQKANSHATTGRVDRTQMVFIASDLRVDTTISVGQPLVELFVSDTETILSAEVEESARSFFPVGMRVEVPTLDASVDGIVTKSKRTRSDETGNPFQAIEVTVPSTRSDQLEPVVVLTGNRIRHADVLTVPVRALLALTEGGWAVEIPDPDGAGTQLAAVELVDVVETTAVIRGLAECDEVVVPL